jgi:hypothetical protein
LNLRDHRNVQEIPRRNPLNFKVASRPIEYKNHLRSRSLRKKASPVENYPDKEMTPVKVLAERGPDIHFSLGG